MRAYRGLRTDPEPQYDVVVVGAGVGGLVCANLLARERLSVLLVEQHYMAGGYCSTFRRRGFTFDAATHFYPLLGNPATITGGLLARLNLPTRWVKMDPVDQFHLPDGSSYVVPADLDEYLARLRNRFPHERAGIDAFFALVREAYLYGLLYHFRGRFHERLEPLALLTVRNAIDRFFTDPKLKLILTADCGHWGGPPSRTSFVFDSMLRLSYFLGNYYPEGGSQRFVDDMAASLEEHGGHILTGAMITRILIDGGRAVGVELEAGYGRRRHRVRVGAGQVVSNADLRLTFETLIGPEHVNPVALRAMRAMRPSHACFLTHIGLTGVPTEELARIAGYHWAGWDPDRVAIDAFKVFVPTLYEPAMAPPGGQVVILQKLTDIDYDKVADWPAHKQQVEQALLERLERILPGVTARAVVCTSASAQTSNRFTLNFRGAMLGWEMSPDQIGEGRPQLDTGIAHLHLVGHWTQPGGGITPVIVSAVRAARAILGGTDTAEPHQRWP